MRPGLYVHVPFCSAICPYCDFSVLTGGPVRRQGYVDSLMLEIEAWESRSREAFGAPFDTVYFGGGTPSSLPAGELARILEQLRRHLEIAPDPWIYLEANPEDVSSEALAAWRRLGVRTLSLGIQAFEAENLRFLGRRHTPDQGRRALRLALEAGFATVAIDLIYALPGQSPERWLRELEQTAEIGPQHLSCYQLTVHQGTPFGFRRDRGQLSELPEEAQADLFLLTHQQLETLGYTPYEVSSFARSRRHRSRHNAKYWQHAPYLGLGPSAHSFAGRRRWWNERKLGRYQQRLSHGEVPVAGEEELGIPELVLEALMLGLRTRDGVDLAEVQRRWGLDLASANRLLIADLKSRRMLRAEQQRLRPTADGLLFADAIARAFQIPAPAPPLLT